MPCIRLVENVAAPEVKVDGQNSNRGTDARGNFTYTTKAKILDDYLEIKECDQKNSQDEQAFSQAILYNVLHFILRIFLGGRPHLYHQIGRQLFLYKIFLYVRFHCMQMTLLYLLKMKKISRVWWIN